MRLIDADKLCKSLDDKYYPHERFVKLEDILETIENQSELKAIVIPPNATNGDMIKAMFPNVEIVRQEINSISNNIVVRDNSFLGAINRFHADWWNAPYKREVEDEQITLYNVNKESEVEAK